MEGIGKRAEAERWLEVAGKLLRARDLVGSKKFAIRAAESDPLLDGVDQTLAVADVLLAAEKRINNHMNWYAILQLADPQNNNRNPMNDDIEMIKKQYRKLALLLDPDKNKSVFAENAFKLVCDAWTVLSDPSKKSLYDNELNLYFKFESVTLNNNNNTHAHQYPSQSQPQQQSQAQQNQETPVRRSTREKRKGTTGGGGGSGGAEETLSQPRNENRSVPARVNPTRANTKMSSFWTSCPYCYNLYEYPRVYEECCLRCQNCRRAFHAAVIPSPPPVVPGQEAYYCCWAFFPLGFQVPSLAGGKNSGFPNWTPFSAMQPISSNPGQLPNFNPFGSKPNGGGGNDDGGGDNDDGGGDNDDGGSDGSWDGDEDDPGRKKGKTSAEVRKGPIVKKTARKSVLPRSTRGNVCEAVHGEPVTRGLSDGNVLPNRAAPQRIVKKAVAKKSTTRSGKFAQDSEIVDLNADVRHEFDDPNSAVGEGVASGDEDPIAGIGFFEGLDDILGHLGNLPILSVPGDQNKTAEQKNV